MNIKDDVLNRETYKININYEVPKNYHLKPNCKYIIYYEDTDEDYIPESGDALSDLIQDAIKELDENGNDWFNTATIVEINLRTENETVLADLLWEAKDWSLTNSQEAELKKYSDQYGYDWVEINDGLNWRIKMVQMTIPQAIEDVKETMAAGDSLYESFNQYESDSINKIEFIYDDTNNKLVDALKFFDTVKDNDFNIIQVRNSSDNSLDMEITKNSDNTYGVVYQGFYRTWNGPGYHTRPAKRKRSYKRLNALFDFITTWYNVNYNKIKREADPYYEDPNDSINEEYHKVFKDEKNPNIKWTGAETYNYKGFKIVYSPWKVTLGDKKGNVDAYIILSNYTANGFLLPLRAEDEDGNELNFNTLDQVKDWIDKYKDNFKIEIKHGDEVHAVVNSNLEESKNSLKAAARKHKRKQKGLSPFSYLNPNAGDVEYNIDFFNRAMGSGDASSTGSGEGMGEDLDTVQDSNFKVIKYNKYLYAILDKAKNILVRKREYLNDPQAYKYAYDNKGKAYFFTTKDKNEAEAYANDLQTDYDAALNESLDQCKITYKYVLDDTLDDDEAIDYIKSDLEKYNLNLDSFKIDTKFTADKNIHTIICGQRKNIERWLEDRIYQDYNLDKSLNHLEFIRII